MPTYRLVLNFHNSGIHMIISENETKLVPYSILNTAECIVHVCSSRQTVFHCGTDEVASYYYTHLRVVWLSDKVQELVEDVSSSHTRSRTSCFLIPSLEYLKRTKPNSTHMHLSVVIRQQTPLFCVCLYVCVCVCGLCMARLYTWMSGRKVHGKKGGRGREGRREV